MEALVSVCESDEAVTIGLGSCDQCDELVPVAAELIQPAFMHDSGGATRRHLRPLFVFL